MVVRDRQPAVRGGPDQGRPAIHRCISATSVHTHAHAFLPLSRMWLWQLSKTAAAIVTGARGPPPAPAPSRQGECALKVRGQASARSRDARQIICLSAPICFHSSFSLFFHHFTFFRPPSSPTAACADAQKKRGAAAVARHSMLPRNTAPTPKLFGYSSILCLYHSSPQSLAPGTAPRT